MFRHVVKIALAVSFLLLLAVPAEFYEYGYRGALKQTAIVVTLFALTACFGHAWVRTLRFIDSPPAGPDARILIALALTAVFVVFQLAYVFLGLIAGAILSGLQISFLAGLFSSGLKPRGARGWPPGFWRKREYLPAMVIMAALGVVLVAAFWLRLRWWSLLVVPAMLLGGELAELIGRSVRQWLLALKQVWDLARRMGPPIGAFAFGYLVIAFIFAGLFASVWRADSTAFKGLSQHPTFIDFVDYSVMTISTTGYGDVAPQSPAAKVLASAEALVGLAWTVVIFAVVLMVVQRQLQSPQGGRDDRDRE
jgi:hypothetical protein